MYAQRRIAAGSSTRVLELGPIWWLVVLLLTLLIGYRFEVGGDWGSYMNYLYRAEYASLAQMMTYDDPGYQLINWVSARLGFGIWGVNLFCGLLFSVGLVRFCRHLPRPWLALAVAMPYLVIVVGMGYTRQAVALGLAMLGLVALANRQTLWFVIWVIVAITIHKSAVLLLPIAALANTENKYWTAFWVAVVTVIAYYLFLEESVDRLYSNYVEAEYQSAGAYIRLTMNVVPALILLAWWRHFSFPASEVGLWRWFAILSIILMVILLLTPATTAVDRVALYMLPLQLVVFAYLPDAFHRSGHTRSLLVTSVLVYYTAVLYVWLNYAAHSRYWVPYQFYSI
jgi:hypothetical protein